MFAKAGDVLVCKSGHDIAVCKKDIVQGNPAGPDDFDWCFDTPKPAVGSPIEPCQKCGELYIEVRGWGAFFPNINSRRNPDASE